MQDFINYTDYIYKVCNPLFNYLPIRHFIYIEARAGGDFYAFSSSRMLFEEYLKRSYYQRTPFQYLIHMARPGIYLNDWYSYPELPPAADHANFLAEFELGHTCQIMRHEIVSGEPVCRIYSFDADLHNPLMNHHYLNNLDLIKKFMDYFDHKVAPVKQPLKTSSFPVQYEMPLSPPILSDGDISMNHKSELLQLFENFERDLNPRPTSRELEIITWNIKGKTAEETATIMGISRRTVEKHFEKLRKKFGCYTKSQVALRMAKYLDI